ncbi:MAG: 4-hydroxy-3-methylbut-2-enyl diphosphate reductase [Flavobacteriales bacterium]|nr:4-hydroxy-3-methylbut-2-enyl diphosphate reductase [Flavobacteriales bacterium]
MKKFDIPLFYRSSFITQIKNTRSKADTRKKDFSPTVLDFGPVQFFMARHFGFCYGVENAIDIAYKAIEENPGKRIFLLSQMIHNPFVNKDLEKNGIRFIMDTNGKMYINWSELTKEDVVLIPAFGTTIEIENQLKEMGITTEKYNTTCPFVEKVWNKSNMLGHEKYTIIIHGKHNHEETRATFSHAQQNAPSIVIRNIAEAKLLADIILGKIDSSQFALLFNSRYSKGFDVEKDLTRVGIVNQTTMLATETQQIADFFKQIMIKKYGIENIQNHFSDTRDTLCYATNDNQEATYALLNTEADFAIVVGGYNSSNTSHIVELCEEKLPTYFISTVNEIESSSEINHYNFHKKEMLKTRGFISPNKNPLKIILTSGASCPDTMVEDVMDKILSFFGSTKSKDDVLQQFIKKG